MKLSNDDEGDGNDDDDDDDDDDVITINMNNDTCVDRGTRYSDIKITQRGRFRLIILR